MRRHRLSAFRNRTGVRRGGFTLLEVLVALMLLTIGISAIMSMSTFSLRNQSVAGELIRAKSIATERLAILAMAPIGQLGDGTATDTRCQQAVVEGGVTVFTVNCTYTAVLTRIDAVVSVTHPLLNNPVVMEVSRAIPIL